MNWSIYHPTGFYMCDIEVAETGDYNVAMVNDVDSPAYKPNANRWVRNPERRDREAVRAELDERGLFDINFPY